MCSHAQSESLWYFNIKKCAKYHTQIYLQIKEFSSISNLIFFRKMRTYIFLNYFAYWKLTQGFASFVKRNNVWHTTNTFTSFLCYMTVVVQMCIRWVPNFVTFPRPYWMSKFSLGYTIFMAVSKTTRKEKAKLQKCT